MLKDKKLLFRNYTQGKRKVIWGEATEQAAKRRKRRNIGDTIKVLFGDSDTSEDESSYRTNLSVKPTPPAQVPSISEEPSISTVIKTCGCVSRNIYIPPATIHWYGLSRCAQSTYSNLPISASSRRRDLMQPSSKWRRNSLQPLATLQ